MTDETPAMALPARLAAATAEIPTGQHPLAAPIGTMALAWNHLHLLVYIFYLRLGGLDPKAAEQKFFDAKFDGPQRKLVWETVLPALRAALPERPELAHEFERIGEEIRAASRFRNAFMHLNTALSFDLYVMLHPIHDRHPPEATTELPKIEAATEAVAALARRLTQLHDALSDALGWEELPIPRG